MTLPSERLTDATVSEAAAQVASDAPTPGGGAVSGLAASLAAALVAMAGRYSTRQLLDGTGRDIHEIVARADELRARALRLADEDIVAYQGYVAAIKLPKTPSPDRRNAALRAALDEAARVPFELTALASEIAESAEYLAVTGNSRLRSDAQTAAYLAAAVAASAAGLVAENLLGRHDERVEQAAGRAATAFEAARRIGTAWHHLASQDPHS